MSTDEVRVFSRAFKLRVIERMDAGESATALSREFGIARQILYRWRDTYRRGGDELALRLGRGRSRRAEAATCFY